MGGLFGLGLGIGIGWAAGMRGDPPAVVYGLLLLALWLAYRAGRRRAAAPVAVAVASAEATAVASSSAAVNVFVAAPAGPAAQRWAGLDEAPWMVQAGQEGIDAQYVRALDSGGDDLGDTDGLDPVEVIERVQRS